MKVSFASAVFFASVAFAAVETAEETGLDIGKLLNEAGPLLKKAKCLGPCVYKASDNLDCNGKGPLSTLCANLDEVKEKTAPCAKKCGIDRSMSGKHEIESLETRNAF
ncbi:hypothetical protein HRG_009463 [Hirsutella rhossiliensis]|uniref:Uncharacterized protein n=1 Tax=Hirsutella rhossiliensis TaxID=111463 RepID=A0A9P8MT07_9HYPO|nr:uncharacterized protein HRG_09463 [Hirsutella rhossiliensis]KAH0959681.1 hypothetical protein HRG_09463 [Hirsutella rhossiliensis]